VISAHRHHGGREVSARNGSAGCPTLIIERGCGKAPQVVQHENYDLITDHKLTGKFIPKGDVKRAELDFVRLGWLSNPASTGAKQLTVGLASGKWRALSVEEVSDARPEDASHTESLKA
jgi:hypothetical protein